MQKPPQNHPVHVAVDPAGPGEDRTVVRFGAAGAAMPIGRQTAANRLTQRWNADPVQFARDLGVELDQREQRVLRASMRGRELSGKRQARVLERVREKIEAGLRRSMKENREGVESEAVQ